MKVGRDFSYLPTDYLLISLPATNRYSYRLLTDVPADSLLIFLPITYRCPYPTVPLQIVFQQQDVVGGDTVSLQLMDILSEGIEELLLVTMCGYRLLIEVDGLQQIALCP